MIRALAIGEVAPNLAIFNNIARNTDKGDRVLVIYGAGHGNYLRQLAIATTREALAGA